MQVSEAYQRCREINQNHYENFPVASMLLPKHIRPAIDAIYAFARTADDFADEAEFDGQRLERIDEWEQKLLADSATDPIFIALHHAIAKHEIPVQLLQDLLTAYRMDVQKSRHESFDDLIFYCKHSANPVGRLVLWLFGFRDESVFELSDEICTGLQLANFWQDVAIDLKKDRIYLPKEDLLAFQVSEQDLFAHKVSPEFKKLMQFQVVRTREIFRAGHALMDHLKGRLNLEIRLTWLGGFEILRRIEAVDYDVYNRRPKLSKADFLRLFCKALFRSYSR